MARQLPHSVDTVIVGNGPSALILSYILHGHVPYYVGGHHDTILDLKLSKRPSLLELTPDLYAHFLSSLRYSTQALPANTLLDTLIRPNADTEVNPSSCIEWRYEPERAISHVAIGDAPQAGGQWAENPVSASTDIGALSYAEQLSLPGYTYAEHLEQKEEEEQCDFVRPSRADMADYLQAYPSAVGISDAIFTDTKIADIHRTADGFVIGSLDICCRHLVLASGIFTLNIPPPRMLAPIAELDQQCEPLLVIGSGFSAADIIISAPKHRKVIHIFQWAPEMRPSPLRGCHHSAYPEYAMIYRQMKLAAIASHKAIPPKSPLLRRKSNPFFSQRDWQTSYEGLPNAEVVAVSRSEATDSAIVTIRLISGDTISRTVGSLGYVVGRRGTLDYLSPDLRAEVAGIDTSPSKDAVPMLISGRTLRSRAESSFEVARHVYIIGSLAGDSLIRHAVGGCVFTAGRIMGAIPSTFSSSGSPDPDPSTPQTSSPICDAEEKSCANLNHTVLALTPKSDSPQVSIPPSPAILANGHADLHLDRRKLARAVEVANVENKFWVDMEVWGR